jgi:surface polysaccharide O-acyltransferase-like enzyme
MTFKRNSNFELLRIICIVGIVIMHSYGSVFFEAKGINLAWGVLINSVFNACVSCFILLSGYFGINFDIRKLSTLHLRVIFFSILSVLILSLFGESVSFIKILKAFFPIISRTYWFISCYFVLYIFSGYINKIPETISKKSFEKLIVLMIIVFSIIPSIFQYELMRDGGKGLINMILMYLIGAYFRKYNYIDLEKIKLLLLIFVLIITNFGINYLITYIKGGIGVNAPFARDNSITIILLSILVFMYFSQIKVQSKVINYIAKSVLSIYIVEGAIRIVLSKYIDISSFILNWYFIFILLIFSAATIFISFILSIFYESLFNKPVQKMATIQIKILESLYSLFINISQKAISFIK